MNKLISERFALRAILMILSVLVVFHMLVLFRVVPFDMVWGGKVANREEMKRLEITSIVITLLMLFVILIRAGILRPGVNRKVVQITLWVMFIFFCFNTIGNALSGNSFERMVFTPITLLLAVFMCRIIRGEK